ncbi:MAG TPA: hypothetical protein VIM16_10725 [Mucilaginibacter sp.]|jgi:uncharacterized protein YabE (DUF348 family)
MTTQFIINNKGEKTEVITPISEYEDLLHQHHLNLEITDEYKLLIDAMLGEENSENVEYVSYKSIKDKFQRN